VFYVFINHVLKKRKERFSRMALSLQLLTYEKNYCCYENVFYFINHVTLKITITVPKIYFLKKKLKKICFF